jgi:hypothetical protein
LKGEIEKKNQFHKRIRIKIEIKNKNKEKSIQQKTQKNNQKIKDQIEKIKYDKLGLKNKIKNK